MPIVTITATTHRLGDEENGVVIQIPSPVFLLSPSLHSPKSADD